MKSIKNYLTKFLKNWTNFWTHFDEILKNTWWHFGRNFATLEKVKELLKKVDESKKAYSKIVLKNERN